MGVAGTKTVVVGGKKRAVNDEGVVIQSSVLRRMSAVKKPGRKDRIIMHGVRLRLRLNVAKAAGRVCVVSGAGMRAARAWSDFAEKLDHAVTIVVNGINMKKGAK